MGTFFIVAGIVLIIMSVILLIASPVMGILGIVFGAGMVLLGRKHRKALSKTKAVEPAEVQPPTQPLSIHEPEKIQAQRINTATALKSTGETHRVAGTSYRQEAIESIGEPNEEYRYTKKEIVDEGLEDERIYEMSFTPQNVELVEEPDNPHDANAIKVIIDGTHVGYIKKGSCAHVKNLIGDSKIEKITAEIGGGKYKFVESDYDDEEDKETYTLKTDKTPYYISIHIMTKE